EQALCATVHGAGRVMSRSNAAGPIRRRKRWACRNRDCKRVFDEGVYPDHPEAGVRKVWIEEQLRRGVVDWPAVQERLRVAAHGDTIRVKHTLRPVGVAMAGREVYDPHKDRGPPMRPPGCSRRPIHQEATPKRRPPATF